MGLAESVTNSRVDFDIEKLFGVSINDKVKTVKGWAYPHWNTPKVDETYVFNRELLAIVLYALEHANQPVLLIGPTGSGKSSVIEQAVARVNRPYYRMNFDGDITRAEFVGQWIINKDRVMEFHYGVLPRAMKEGAVLVCDELDCASPTVVFVLQNVLDGGALTLLETGEIIEPHSDFRIFATANIQGLGDSTGLYSGTQPQNFATLNRFKLVRHVDYLSEDQERQVVMRKLGLEEVALNSEVLTKLVQYASLVRSAYKKNEIMATISTRAVINIADKFRAFGDVEMAYELGFLSLLSEDDRRVCRELLQRVWGV